jgi:hypothetical protein
MSLENGVQADEPGISRRFDRLIKTIIVVQEAYPITSKRSLHLNAITIPSFRQILKLDSTVIPILFAKHSPQL